MGHARVDNLAIFHRFVYTHREAHVCTRYLHGAREAAQHVRPAMHPDAVCFFAGEAQARMSWGAK